MKNKTKAVVVYLDDSDNMETELSWLYKTWILNNLDKEWDLVVYYNPPAEKRLESFIGIKKVPMAPVRRSKWYPFLNSHYFCLTEYSDPIRDYEFLLKTDCDVFLTPNLRGYKPSAFHYGLAQWYSSEDTAAITHWMKHELSPNLKLSNGGPCDYRFMTNVGASFLGKAHWVINVTSQQAIITEQLLDMFEKSPFYCDLGVLDGEKAFKQTQKIIGPTVMEGIASMIGGEIAVNSLMYPQHTKPLSLDTKCWETVDVGTDVLHIHAWHTNAKFSKHHFFNGKYDDWTVHYDNRLDNCANYCQWIATTPIEEIRKIAKKGKA